MGHLSVVQGELILKSDYQERFAAKAAGGQWDKSSTVWRYPATLAAATRLRGAYRDGGHSLTEDELLDEFLAGLGGEITFAQEVKTGKTVVDYNPRTEPYGHQKTGTGFILSMKRCFLWDEQGLGKTKQAIDAAVQRINNGDIKTCVVLCPSSLKFQWAEQVRLHGGLSDYHVRVSHGAKPRRLKLYNEVAEATGSFLILSYDTIRSDADELLDIVTDSMLVMDEHQAVKNSRTQRSRAARNLARCARFVVLMTGTPVWNNPSDLWHPASLVANGALPTTFRGFQNRYCTMGGFKGKQVLGFRNLKEMKMTLEPYALRRLKSECVDLPPKIYSDVTLELETAERNAYNDMKEDLVAFVARQDEQLDSVAVRSALAQLTKLRQITGGFIYDEDGDTRWIGNTKINAVKDLLEMHKDKKIIIWSSYRAPLMRMQEEFADLQPVVITGEVNHIERDAGRQRFQNDGNCRLLLGQMQTGGVGLDLPAATVHIFYDLDWNLSVMLQAEDRSHRIGQTEQLSIIRLMARETVDEYMAARLRRKQGWANEILNKSELSSVIAQL